MNFFLSILKKFFLGILALVLLLACAGFLYQFISTKIDEKKYPPLGQLVDIGGYHLHLYGTGDSKGPTVILDSGLGGNSLDWALVQPKIAEFAKVYSYDRAGLGWSEESPFPRTSEQIVIELHTLLTRANIQGPYILVGHSLGGANMQLFTSLYPNEVSGIVLVDACHEEQEKRLPPSPEIDLTNYPYLVNVIMAFGIPRLGIQYFEKDQLLLRLPIPQLIQNQYFALLLTTKNNWTALQEKLHFKESLHQLENANQKVIKSKPLIVLTAGNLQNEGETEDMQKWAKEVYFGWQQLQQELVAKSAQGKQIIAEKSNHMIPYCQPELIVEAVREIVNGL